MENALQLVYWIFPSSHNHGSGKWLYLKGNDPIGDTPILDFHDYGRKSTGYWRQPVLPHVSFAKAWFFRIKSEKKSGRIRYRSRVRPILGSIQICHDWWMATARLHSLKLTASLHLKMDGWKTFSFPFGMASWEVLCLFQGAYIGNNNRKFWEAVGF